MKQIFFLGLVILFTVSMISPGWCQGGKNNDYSYGDNNQSGGDNKNMDKHGPPEPGWMKELSEDQKEELREAIRYAVEEKLNDWGIEVKKKHGPPPPPDGNNDEFSGKGDRPSGPPPDGNNDEFSENGDRPSGPPPDDWMKELTKEQRGEIKELMMDVTREKLEEWDIHVDDMENESHHGSDCNNNGPGNKIDR